MLGMIAIANAAQENGARWPSIDEPQWPNVSRTPIGDLQKPATVPATRNPEIITGSAPSPVARRWHDFKSATVIVVPAFQGELGLRYWMNFGQTAKNLYNIAGNAMVSRLTYDGLQGHSAELFGRLADLPSILGRRRRHDEML
jgi:hypothetical protein